MCQSLFVNTRSDSKKRYSWQFWRKTVCCWVSFPGFQLLMLHFGLAATNPKHQNLTTWGRDTTISFLSPELLVPREFLQVQTLPRTTIVGHNWWLLGTIFVEVNKSYFPAKFTFKNSSSQHHKITLLNPFLWHVLWKILSLRISSIN